MFPPFSLQPVILHIPDLGDIFFSAKAGYLTNHFLTKYFLYNAFIKIIKGNRKNNELFK